MKLGLFVVLAATLAVSFVPAASANQNICVNGTAPPCVQTFSSSSGAADCSTAPSSQMQRATVTTGSTAVGSYRVNAQNSCSLVRFFGFTFGSSYLGASATGSGTPAGFVFGQASWSTSTFGATTTCQTSASAFSTATGSQGTGNLGCPAGRPPQLPHVLP